jgi:hypothetical protein
MAVLGGLAGFIIERSRIHDINHMAYASVAIYGNVDKRNFQRRIDGMGGTLSPCLLPVTGIMPVLRPFFARLQPLVTTKVPT